MSDPIKIGDVVVVYRPWTCCGRNDMGTGAIRTVLDLRFDEGSCFQCGAKGFHTAALGGGWCPIDRLKRIPPLEETDDVKHEETVEA